MCRAPTRKAGPVSTRPALLANRGTAFIAVLVVLLAAVWLPGCRPDTLRAVERRGRIVAGTSADLPPFEFKDARDRFAGFDIELMNEIARRLGVAVEWKDMKAEALLGALGRREVDVVIAALVPTPELENLADFTGAYLVSPEVVVVRKDAGISIADLAQLASYRVGVQAGTPEEAYCRDQFVAAGLMPETDLCSYPTAATALAELVAGRVDCAFVDQEPAAALAERGEVVKVLSSRLPHEPAVAIRRGQAPLLAELNEIIAALREEGFVRQLANKYGVAGE